MFILLWPDVTSSLFLGCSKVRLCRGLIWFPWFFRRRCFKFEKPNSWWSPMTSVVWKKNTMYCKSMATVNCLVSKILPNIFFCAQKKKETHRFETTWVYYFFKTTNENYISTLLFSRIQVAFLSSITRCNLYFKATCIMQLTPSMQNFWKKFTCAFPPIFL